MGSLYLRRLSEQDRAELIDTLLESQNGNCFICGKKVDRILQKDNIDIDHVEPTKVGGKDGPENFAVTHDRCNRSKQASDLRVARILASFDHLAGSIASKNRAPI